MILVDHAEIRPKMIHFPQTKTFYRERVTIYSGPNYCSVVWNLKEIILAVQQNFRSRDIKMPHFGPQMLHFLQT